MRRLSHERVRARSRRFYLLGVTSLGVVLGISACGKSEDDSGKPSGAAGGGGAPAHGGASAAAGASNHPAGGSGGTGNANGAGAPTVEAGAGGGTDAGGDAGAAGASADAVTCEAGGTVFVVGNYSNAAGDELLLRSTASASTIALVPKGPAVPAKPPQLFAVERVCASGGALIVSDASSRYRVDFSQSGGQIAICISSPTATLDAASKLLPADLARVSDTGCAGHPFGVYTAEAL